MFSKREHGIPVYNRRIEKPSQANSNVNVYQLSESELEEYRRKYPSEKLSYKKPTVVYSEKPIRFKPKITMKKIPIDQFTKEKYLEYKSKGLSDAEIVKLVHGLYISKLTKMKKEWRWQNVETKF